MFIKHHFSNLRKCGRRLAKPGGEQGADVFTKRNDGAWFFRLLKTVGRQGADRWQRVAVAQTPTAFSPALLARCQRSGLDELGAAVPQRPEQARRSEPTVLQFSGCLKNVRTSHQFFRRISTWRPVRARFVAVTVPWQASTQVLTMARPRPMPPVSRLREASRR